MVDPTSTPQAVVPPSAPTVVDTREDVWRAYELAVRHYERDLDLFSTRMNLFLAIHAVLFGAASGAFGPSSDSGRAVPELGIAGVFLAAVWLLVANSSYVWIHEWRYQVLNLANEVKTVTGVRLGTDIFGRSKARNRIGRLGWRLRPQLSASAFQSFCLRLGIYRLARIADAESAAQALGSRTAIASRITRDAPT